MTEDSFMKLLSSEEVKKIASRNPFLEAVDGNHNWDIAFDLWVAANVRVFVDKLRGVPSVLEISSASDGVYDIVFMVGYGGKIARFRLTTKRFLETRFYLKIVRYFQPNHKEWEQVGDTSSKNNEVAVTNVKPHIRYQILLGR
jgi:hypothetical protein